jgi:hypothetical protein
MSTCSGHGRTVDPRSRPREPFCRPARAPIIGIWMHGKAVADLIHAVQNERISRACCTVDQSRSAIGLRRESHGCGGTASERRMA